MDGLEGGRLWTEIAVEAMATKPDWDGIIDLAKKEGLLLGQPLHDGEVTTLAFNGERARQLMWLMLFLAWIDQNGEGMRVELNLN